MQNTGSTSNLCLHLWSVGRDVCDDVPTLLHDPDAALDNHSQLGMTQVEQFLCILRPRTTHLKFLKMITHTTVRGQHIHLVTKSGISKKEFAKRDIESAATCIGQQACIMA